MFGGKKEKALETELNELKESYQKQEEALREIRKQKDFMEEQFASIVITNARMQKDLELASNHTSLVEEFATKNSAIAEELHNKVQEAVNLSKKADDSGKDFLDGMKTVQDAIQEIVEQNKHFTSPMKALTEAPSVYQEEYRKADGKLTEMLDLSKNMGVLALNAAIEAGRMGEQGKKFISAAEDIRAFSEEYMKATEEAKSVITDMAGRVTQMEEQMKILNELLKENNIFMGKVLKETTSQIESFEKEHVVLGGILTTELSKKAEEFLQGEKELSDIGNRLGMQVQDMVEAYNEQKQCTDELEKGFEQIKKEV